MKPRKLSPSVSLERLYAKPLGDAALAFNKTHDITPETAIALGTKRSHAARITDKNGEAKTGGTMLNGKLDLCRYISYRLLDTKVSLVMELPEFAPIGEVYFAVRGTEDVLSEGEVRYAAFAPALKHYTEVLATFAPKRN